MIKEPTRLRAASDELASAVSALGQQVPSEDRLAALAARLAEAGAPVSAEPPPPASTAAPKPLASVRPELTPARRLLDSGALAIVVALVAAVGLVAVAVKIRSADVPLVPAASAPQATPAVATAPLPTVRDESASAVGAGEKAAQPRPTTVGAGRPVPSSTAEPAPTAAAPEAAPTATERALASVPDRAAPNDTARAPAPPSTPRRSEPPRSTTSAPSPAAEHDGSLPAGDEAVPSEVELLKNARSALAADPARAFALTEQCKARYSGGAFAQEREYIAIVALARLGRLDEARSRASTFRMHYKSSAYLPRLAPIVGAE